MDHIYKDNKPMSVAPMATLSILTFIGRWNELLEPLIYLSKQKLYTLPLGIAFYLQIKAEYNGCNGCISVSDGTTLVVFSSSETIHRLWLDRY